MRLFFNRSPATIGWYQALFTVMVLWGLNNVVLRFSSVYLQVNPVIYACSGFISSSVILLLIAGKGRFSRETLRSPTTWVYGVVLLAAYLISLNLFAVVTSTEGSLIQRLSVVVAVGISWVFMHRRPGKDQLIGIMLILIGIIIVLIDLDKNILPTVFILMILSGFIQAIRILVAETHPESNQAAEEGTIKDRCRVVGFVMLVTSVLFLGFSFVLALFLEGEPVEGVLSIFPTLDDFFDKQSVLMGAGAGLLLVAPIRYLEFSSARLIKAENFLAITALSSVATFFWEWFFTLFNVPGIELKSVGIVDFIAGILITFGALYMACQRLKSEFKTSHHEKVTDFLSHIDDSKI